MLQSEYAGFALGYQENYDTTSGTLEASELDGIPLFIQWDKRWGYDAYGMMLSDCQVVDQPVFQ